MKLTKTEEHLVLGEVLSKFEYGKDYKKYRDLEKGCAIWRRGYLRTYNDTQPSHQRTREQKYFLGLIFRSVEQFAADAKDALFSNDPFFTVRPRGMDPRNEAVGEAVQALMEYNTTEPIDYPIQFLRAYRHANIFGVSYLAPFYDYKEMQKTTYGQSFDPVSGERKVFIDDQPEAVADHPDFDVVYPTRVILDPAAQFGKINQTADWRIIERQRPWVWYLDKQDIYGYSNKIRNELKWMSGSTIMDTEGPNNFEDNWNLNTSKMMNELEYIGRILDPKLKHKFSNKRRYIVTIVNKEMVVRCDISTAPDGLALHAMNIVPDLEGAHIGIGIVDPAVDYQRAVNEWYNLRMRGLGLAVNPAWLVNSKAFPEWKQLEDHPPGKIFPTDGDYDARKIIQQLNPADASGATWEQMIGFTQRDHDLTTGTSASRLGSIESKERTATELTQVKEGADKRSNALIYVAVRTGHRPLLMSMLQYTLSFWSTPRNLRLTNQRTLEQKSVLISPDDIRNADVMLDIVDATGGSIDQQMAFYSRLYQLSLSDPLINRTKTLLNMLKNSRIVTNPYDLMAIDPALINQNMASAEQAGQMPGFDNLARESNTDVQASNRRFSKTTGR